MNTYNASGLVKGYEKNWYFADTWIGGYPVAFSVAEGGVELLGRAEMSLSLPKNVTCSVPQYATFSPSNTDRNEADQVLYRSATEVINVTISRDVQVIAKREIDDSTVTLDLKKHDTLYLIHYVGDATGLALYHHNGENYVINENDFQKRALYDSKLIIMSEDVSLNAKLDANHSSLTTLDLKKGDTLHLDLNNGNRVGSLVYQYDDQSYLIDQADIEDKSFSSTDGNRRSDSWLRLPTADSHCWMLYSDAVDTDGIIVTDFEGHDIANDLPSPSSPSLNGVAFHSSSADLTEESKEILSQLATQLQNVSDIDYEVAGYTDSSGRSDTNQKLSQQRAQAVVDCLVKEFGVDSSLLTAVGYGESNPIADNATSGGRAENRRVELISIAC